MAIFDDYFNEKKFDSSNPGNFNYMTEALRLARQRDTADQFGAVRMPGTKKGNIASLLAQGLGGYLKGRNNAQTDNFEQEGEKAREYYEGQYNNIDVEGLKRQAMEKYKAPEAMYVHNKPEEVGPQMPQQEFGTAATETRGFNPMATQSTEDRGFSPATVVPQSPVAMPQTPNAGMGRGTVVEQPGERAAYMAANQPSIDSQLNKRDEMAKQSQMLRQQAAQLGAGTNPNRNPAAAQQLMAQASALDTQIRQLENSIAPAAQNGPIAPQVQREVGGKTLTKSRAAAGAPAITAPKIEAPKIEAPVAPVAPAAPPQVEYEQKRVTGPDPTFKTVNPTPEQLAEVDTQRGLFLRNSVKAQRDAALKGLSKGNKESRALYKTIMANEAAARNRQLDREDKIWEWQNKPTEVGDGKSIVIPGTGQVVANGGQSVAAQKFQWEKEQDEKKSQQSAQERSAKAQTGLRNIDRALSDVDDVIRSDAPERADGLSGLLGDALSMARITNKWTDAKKQLEGLTNGAIQAVISDMAAAGIAPSQLVNTQIEALRAAGSKLNLDIQTMSDKQMRVEIAKYREMLVQTKQMILEQIRGSATKEQTSGNISPSGREFPRK